MSIYWHNNSFTDNEYIISIHDRIRLGEGVFATILITNREMQHFDLHLQKLYKGCDIFFGSWNAPAPETLQTAAEQLITKNNISQGRYALNITVTLGASGSGIRPPESPPPQITMRITACPSEFPPVHAIIAQTVRRNEGSPLSQIKCSAYGENILALREAMGKSANEAIMLNNAGRVTCSTVSSLFMLKQGKLYTPPLSDGVQEGVTRRLLIEQHGAIEQSLYPEDIKTADGLFLANSIRGIAPIISLDGEKLLQPTDELLVH